MERDYNVTESETSPLDVVYFSQFETSLSDVLTAQNGTVAGIRLINGFNSKNPNNKLNERDPSDNLSYPKNENKDDAILTESKVALQKYFLEKYDLIFDPLKNNSLYYDKDKRYKGIYAPKKTEPYRDTVRDHFPKYSILIPQDFLLGLGMTEGEWKKDERAAVRGAITKQVGIGRIPAHINFTDQTDSKKLNVGVVLYKEDLEKVKKVLPVLMLSKRQMLSIAYARLITNPTLVKSPLSTEYCPAAIDELKLKSTESFYYGKGGASARADLWFKDTAARNQAQATISKVVTNNSVIWENSMTLVVRHSIKSEERKAEAPITLGELKQYLQLSKIIKDVDTIRISEIAPDKNGIFASVEIIKHLNQLQDDIFQVHEKYFAVFDVIEGSGDAENRYIEHLKAKKLIPPTLHVAPYYKETSSGREICFRMPAIYKKVFGDELVALNASHRLKLTPEVNRAIIKMAKEECKADHHSVSSALTALKSAKKIGNFKPDPLDKNFILICPEDIEAINGFKGMPYTLSETEVAAFTVHAKCKGSQGTTFAEHCQHLQIPVEVISTHGMMSSIPKEIEVSDNKKWTTEWKEISIAGIPEEAYKKAPILQSVWANDRRLYITTAAEINRATPECFRSAAADRAYDETAKTHLRQCRSFYLGRTGLDSVQQIDSKPQLKRRSSVEGGMFVTPSSSSSSSSSSLGSSIVSSASQSTKKS